MDGIIKKIVNRTRVSMSRLVLIIANPILVFCFILTVGLLINNIKIMGVGIGLAGTLYAAIIVGVLLPNRNNPTDEYNYLMLFFEIISNIGSVFFSASIGIYSGYLLANFKTRIRSLVVGASIVIFNYMIMRLFLLLSPELDKSIIYGIFCGAMTSTPGLSAGSELLDKEKMTSGYCLSYLIGVTAIIMFTSIQKNKYDNSFQKTEKEITNSQIDISIIQIPIAIILGSIIGKIHVTPFNISMGNTGGIIIMGIVVGLISKKYKKIDGFLINIIRNVGLVLFLVGNGFTCARSFYLIKISNVVPFSIIFSITPILLGYLISLLVYKKKTTFSISSVCGIMTSSPAFGVLSNGVDDGDIYTIFSFTYIGALMTMLACMRII